MELAELDQLTEDMIVPVPGAPPSLEDALREYFVAQGIVEDAKKRMTYLKEFVTAVTNNDEPGKYEISAGNYIATVTIAERYSWNEEELVEIMGKLPSGTSVPAVSAKWKVDRAVYDSMSSSEQDVIKSALTIEPGSKMMKVRKNV